MAEIDKDAWTRRFIAQLSILDRYSDRDREPQVAMAIAKDCLESDGRGLPETATRRFVEVTERAGPTDWQRSAHPAWYGDVLVRRPLLEARHGIAPTCSVRPSLH